MAKAQQLALPAGTGFFKGNSGIMTLLKRSPELVLPMGILMIIGLLIVPLPQFMLDVLLSLNIAISILILFISIYVLTPVEFSAFPTVLLITTLFRLGLNVASTRLILGEGAAGEIIKAFGTYVIKGNYIVGVLIFIILLVINFIVIIKGSSRIAEVSARFTLDAMPGKQMSIDADLNAGHIDEKEARHRRESLTKEADFYGSMDGAAKFIKGDAIAGLIITGINILAGFTIGVAQRGMDITQAISVYTILTIGDGLVSQIPSLLISVAAGLVVTRSTGGEKLENELGRQFGAKPKALALASGSMLLFSVMPGLPMFPFLLLAGITGGLAYLRTKAIHKEKAGEIQKVEADKADKEKKPEESPVEELLRIDPIEIELGYSLIVLVDETQGGDVFKRISTVRRQLATELGIILPPVRVRDNLQLEPEEYVIKIRGNELSKNIIYPMMLLAMNPGTAEGDISGIKVTEPVFGLPGTWIDQSERENAEILGYTVVESATVLITHLTELLRRNADKLLTRQDVKQLIENLKEDYPALVEELSPDNLPTATLQKVLQNLLREGIPIRDLPLIIESLLEYFKITKNIDVLTEYVRHNLSETIKKLYQDQNGVIHAIALDPQLEQTMNKSLQANSQASLSSTLGFPIEIIKNIHKSLSEAIDEITLAGYLPIVICSAQVRPYFYRLIHTQFPMVSVISFTELPSETDIEIQSSVQI